MTSRIKANEIDALTAGAALSVNATPTFTKAGTFSDTLSVGANLTVTKNITASANVSVTGNFSQSGSSATLAEIKTSSTASYAELLIEDGNAGYAWQTRSDNAQSTLDGSFLLNDRRGTFPIIIEENNATNTLLLSNDNVLRPLQAAFGAATNSTNIDVSTKRSTTENLVFNVDSGNDGQFDVGGDYDTTTGKFTAPVAGKYMFHLKLQCNSMYSTNSSWTINPHFQVNEAGNFGNTYWSGGTSTSGSYAQYDMVDQSIVLDLAANDTVRVDISYESTATGTIETSTNDGRCRFWGYLLG